MNYCLFASKQGLLFESHALFEGVNIIGMGVNIVRICTIYVFENRNGESLASTIIQRFDSLDITARTFYIFWFNILHKLYYLSFSRISISYI